MSITQPARTSTPSDAVESGPRYETAAQARLAVAHVLDADHRLAELLEVAVVPDPPDQLRLVRPCGQCETGSLHVMGVQKLASGRQTVGAFVICDSCGYYGGRR